MGFLGAGCHLAVSCLCIRSAWLHNYPMVNYYDEVEIEDFAWDPLANVFHYPCPCGDRFEISKAQLRDGDEVATCPSCSLIVRIIYDYVSALFYAPALIDVCSSIGRITSLRTRRMRRSWRPKTVTLNPVRLSLLGPPPLSPHRSQKSNRMMPSDLRRALGHSRCLPFRLFHRPQRP